jgi:ATP-dependent DNA ligase
MSRDRRHRVQAAREVVQYRRRRCAVPTAHSTAAVAPLPPSSFDLLELNGEDLRPLPLEERKAKLARLLARTNVGIALNEHTDADGATVFQQACAMGLKGMCRSG